MAYAQTLNDVRGTGLGNRLSALVAEFRANRARKRVYKQTVAELSMLSNRELADLGLGRSEIRRVAYQAAYEA
ncbi:DUF1127 domain-containing protein [Roseivivax sp. CAU 1761]